MVGAPIRLDREAVKRLTKEARVAVHPLRLARVARGISQRELERLAGLPATSLSHVEAGRRQLDPAAQWRIAEALKVDHDEVFPWSNGAP
jgi:transcriptional regulator with XRE-family HTH domain